ncbi:P-II family nitrogen regulator [Hujiaoplasma nucleasis]|uniref:P-II family nitrogen regulator n=1 Tax=Hujiaoplasma nucleasis TaxID=2725268 RepID=A0A7L6N145_9MOLU|nr:hypothetical protein [Hujiaoplasma nucleasis]QLY39976.1 P-II family nitrogen regulator [Hujiaoplasma nucleasis]
MNNQPIEVILYVCNHGYAYEAMSEARKAGARGGTIIHGRSSISTEKEKFFGITLHPEKDILMIVCLADQKNDLMKALTSKYGVTTEARGLCFSMPVSDAIGFSFESIPFPKE